MGELEPMFCIKCGGRTMHEWRIDRDSDQNDPLDSKLYTVCLKCEGRDDFFEKFLPKGQRELEL